MKVTKTLTVIAEQDGQTDRLRAEMVWAQEDPAVVHMVLTHDTPGHDCVAGACESPWQIGRELLVDACIHGKVAGVHEVIAKPDSSETLGPVVILHLDGDVGHMHILLSRQSLYRFLGETLQFTPVGMEDYTAQVDKALAHFGLA